MGEREMKLTKDKLKNIILEVLSEATQETEYKRVFSMLSGGVDAVDQVAILTPENPKAKPISPEQNAARIEEFKKELAMKGYGWIPVAGMYGGPENSFMIPHMTLEDAKEISYKYGQEAFVHSSKGEAEDMVHSLEFPDYSQQELDPNYDEATYGPINIVPPEVTIASSVPGTRVKPHSQMANQQDFYSHVPDKKWDEKVKKGKHRPAGEKLGKKYAVDLDFGSTMQGGYTPKPGLKSTRHMREGRYVFISENDVPNTIQAKRLARLIREESLKISESNRFGSSRYYARMKVRGLKKQLIEMIQKRNK
jgi:hypothetical protein